MKLRNHRKRQQRVNFILGTSAVEILVAVSIRVVAASPLVAIPRRLPAVQLVIAGPDALGFARMGGIHGGARVGLPDVHLVAAGAELARVGYAVDEAEDGALRVAVARAVFRAGGVETFRYLAAAVEFHVGEVEGAVHAAG